MAYHWNTPDSVLEVPQPSSVTVHANKGMSRAQRRAEGNRRRESQNTPFVGKVRDQLADDTPNRGDRA